MSQSGISCRWVEHAHRRLAEAKELGPRTALNGQPLPPVLAEVAAAQAAGAIGPEHVAVIRNFFDTLPHWVDPTTRTATVGLVLVLLAASAAVYLAAPAVRGYPAR